MQNQRLATRYAKSILDLAVERGELETVYSDMQYLSQVVKASPEFVSLLKSPVIASDRKTAAINAVTKGNVSTLTTTFTNLMISKNREAELPDVINAFVRQYKDMKGIHIVKLTTAMPVSEEVKKAIVEQVKKTSNFPHIELETIVNPDIIGGFVLQAGDKLVDASISYDLQAISREFENNDFIYKVR